MTPSSGTHEPQDIIIPLSRAARIFDISVAAILQHAIEGDVTLSDDEQHVRMSECERWAEARGYPEVRLVRALSVLDRMKTVYTTGQVAKVLGVSPDLVIRLIDSGAMQGYRLPQTSPAKQGGDRRVTKQALAEYLAENPCAQSAAMGYRQPAKRRAKA